MRQATGAADRAIEQLLARQGNVITRVQLLRAGWTEATVRYRTRPGGLWAVTLPGVYVRGSESLTDGQRETAAALYAGPDSVITGRAAARQYGLRVPITESVDVLVPRSSKRQSAGFVRIRRTSRMPAQPAVAVRAGVRWAPGSRAVADAVRADLALSDARALIAEAVQRRVCLLPALAEELRAGPKRESGKLRAVLDEVADGVRSAAETDMRKLIKVSKLPEPMYNPRLYVGDEFLAQPDVWWRDAGVAGEVDSREWHLSPEMWARTMERHAAMTARGILVIHVSPRQIRTQGNRVASDLRSAIEAGRRRPALTIRTVPTS
jgi:hypothetical protein